MTALTIQPGSPRLGMQSVQNRVTRQNRRGDGVGSQLQIL
jgi:hypothetical protein